MENKKNIRKVTEYSYARKSIEKQIRLRREILLEDNYITWLVEFIKKYKGFTDYDLMPNKEGISEKDYQNIEKLKELYKIIEEYDSNNGNKGRYHDSTIVFVLYYKETYFEIGFSLPPMGYIFVNISKTTTDAINFEDVVINIKKSLLKKKNKFNIPNDLLSEENYKKWVEQLNSQNH